MKQKLLNILLLVTFHFGYLEWGNNKSMFIFQAAQEIFSKAVTDFKGIVHPFILIPFAGIIFLLITLFQSTPSRKLTLAGLACLSVLMLFLFFIGLISLNARIFLAAVPFVVTGVVVVLGKRPQS